jgi:hypothetical protein
LDWDKEIGLELVIGGYSVTLGVWEIFWEVGIWRAGLGVRNSGDEDVEMDGDGGDEEETCWIVDWFEGIMVGSPQLSDTDG